MKNTERGNLCGYCDDLACKGISDYLDTITIISSDKALPYEILQWMKPFIKSGDGYEEDIDRMVGFTAYITTDAISFIKQLHLQAPTLEMTHLTECKSWGFILEVLR